MNEYKVEFSYLDNDDEDYDHVIVEAKNKEDAELKAFDVIRKEHKDVQKLTIEKITKVDHD